MPEREKIEIGKNLADAIKKISEVKDLTVSRVIEDALSLLMSAEFNGDIEEIKKKINYQHYSNFLDFDATLTFCGSRKKLHLKTRVTKEGEIKAIDLVNEQIEKGFTVPKSDLEKILLAKIADLHTAIKKEQPYEKPPIGIMPENTWKKLRIKELKLAIQRYVDAGLQIPTEWVDEFNRKTI